MAVNILDCRVHMVDMEESLQRIEAFIEEGTPHHVITLNAEIIHRAQKEEKLKNVINSAHLVTPDGAGVLWASRRLAKPLQERVTGIDLTLQLASRAAEKNWHLFFYGGAPGAAAQAAENLKKRHPDLRVVGTAHGYLQEEEKPKLIEEIKEKKPHILLVALGAPNQEYWIREHMDTLNVPVFIGVGGTFDVLSGRTKRAPLWMQKLGLEWAYRFASDPKRFKRILAIPMFMLQVKLKAGGK